jgi:hypothetical protein
VGAIVLRKAPNPSGGGDRMSRTSPCRLAEPRPGLQYPAPVSMILRTTGSACSSDFNPPME